MQELRMSNKQVSERRRQAKKRRRELLRKAKAKQTRQSQTHKQPDDSVVGYVARRGVVVVCDEQKWCVVTSSRAGMKSFIENHGSRASDYVIEPATVNHILTAMSMGGKYALDQKSYQRILKPANAAGFGLKPMEFRDAGSEGIYLVRVP